MERYKIVLAGTYSVEGREKMGPRNKTHRAGENCIHIHIRNHTQIAGHRMTRLGTLVQRKSLFRVNQK